MVLRRYEVDFRKWRLYCLIEFEDQDVVNKIALDGYININGERIEIELMEGPEDYMNQPPYNIEGLFLEPPYENPLNGLNISELNDDCLRLVFRKLSLSGLSTLYSIANVCVNFNKIANEIFGLKYRKKQFRFCDFVMNYPISLLQIEDFLKTFGSSIENLWIGQVEFNFNEYQLNDVLMLINKNCINLKVLDMQKLTVKEKISSEVFPLFSRLESLKIKFDHCKSIDSNELFFGFIILCTQLRHFDVIHHNDNIMNGGIVEMKGLPKLSSIAIETSNLEYLQLLLLNNPQLEEISLRLFTDTENVLQTPNFFRLFCEQFANIEKLSIAVISNPDEIFSTSVMQLSELKRLRYLHIHFNYDFVLPFVKKMLENNIELETLAIDDGFIDNDTINVISQIKSISTLKFMLRRTWFDENNLIQLLKRLSTLRELHIEMPDDATEILDTIKLIIFHGKQLSNLTIEVRSHEMCHIREEEFDELLAIVKKRNNPKKMMVFIKGEWQYFCETTLNYVNMNSEHLSLDIQYHSFNGRSKSIVYPSYTS